MEYHHEHNDSVTAWDGVLSHSQLHCILNVTNNALEWKGKDVLKQSSNGDGDEDSSSGSSGTCS
jgi:hypothetical protein